MTDFLDKFKIATTKQRQRKFNFRNEHMTTSDFCTLGVANYRNMIPNERIEVNFRSFARLAAMPVPTFGRANLNVRGFFVPFRTIFPAWTDFITDTPHVSSEGLVTLTSVPYMYQYMIVWMLTNNATVVTANDNYDFASNFDGSNAEYNGALQYYKLNPVGRAYYKLFVSLGYQPLNIITHDNYKTKVSALPLLAFAKIYCDWYWSSAYANSTAFAAVDAIFKRDVADPLLRYNDVVNILNLAAFVQYDSDYFVSAFDSPAGPSSDFHSDFSIQDSSYTGSAPHADVTTLSSGTAVLSPSTGSNQRYISQYAIDTLKRLSSYMRRHQLAGSRSLDRYLARFNVNLAPEKLQRSVYLGSHKVPLMTGDVMATAQTYDDSDNVSTFVGDYAGKGFLVGKDGHFEFSTDEYGIFLCLYSIMPEVGYYQGIDRHNLHLSRLDFFTPEFDGNGTRAISSAELYQPFDAYNVGFADNYNNIFGYTPQYSEYKIGRDCVSGDYRCRSLSKAGDTSIGWHLMRSVGSNESAPLVHSIEFTRTANDKQQYNRIFYNTDNSADHFNLHFFFGVTSWLPAKPLYDLFDWEEEGKAVTLDVNGVKMN